MLKILRILPAARRLCVDCRGVSAVEFAFVLPLMLTLFVMTVELSNAFSVNRKVTITARSLSDLISRATVVTGADLTGTFTAGSKMLEPYSSAPLKAVISEVKIDAAGIAKIAWSMGHNTNPRVNGQIVALPAALAVPNTYLIWGEANYTYTPIAGYLSRLPLALGNQFFTRPRQSTCVLYNTTSCP